jgi:HSP20 family molecular chaperone IbpA
MRLASYRSSRALPPRGAAAELKDGVLQLSLPKTSGAGEEAKVSVQAA